MLSRPGEIPVGHSWSFDVKWDGFRALVSTEDGLRVRSRRGWNMTALLPELEDLPAGLVLDAELGVQRRRRSRLAAVMPPRPPRGAAHPDPAAWNSHAGPSARTGERCLRCLLSRTTAKDK
jgi:hypothetical protein